MNNIYLSSDLHLCHDKDFIYAPRGFANVDQMNQTIVGNWNSIIDWNDDVYVLGDIMLNNDFEGLKILKSLKGKIHIIRGNHDSDNRMTNYRSAFNVVEVCEGKFLKYDGYSFYLTHYPCITTNGDSDKPLKRRMINLCGHRHAKDKWADFDKGLIYHCELDAHNNVPVNINDIISDLKIKCE